MGLRSLIVELRLLSIDNSETLEVIAIEFMNVLQSILENIWRIQDLFDVTYGISVNKFNDSILGFDLVNIRIESLIVLILFLRQLSITKCVKMFDTLIKQLFSLSLDRTNLLSRLWRILRSWYRNEYHDAKTLKSHLKEALDF